MTKRERQKSITSLFSHPDVNKTTTSNSAKCKNTCSLATKFHTMIDNWKLVINSRSEKGRRVTL